MQTEVFISYKIGEPRSEQLRDELRELLQKAPYELSVITDITHLQVMEDIEAFMTQLAKARFVVVILTSEFLHSENCMFELATMSAEGRLKERVFPIVFGDAVINNHRARMKHALYWRNEHKALKEDVDQFDKNEIHEITLAELNKLETITKESQNALTMISRLRHLAVKVEENPKPAEIAKYIDSWTHKNGKKTNKQSTKTNQKEAKKASSQGQEKSPKGKTDKFAIEMVPVKGGTFKMGSDEGRVNEKPVHQVTLSDYEIGKYPVTQAQWKAIMGDSPSYFEGPENLPVEQVSWNDIQKFIEKLNKQSGHTYRLPTEAEWEFAARGGNSSKGSMFSGSNNLDEVGWYGPNSDNKTHPVGKKLPNELGLHDMSGNVWEWCQDWFGDYKPGPQKNPTGAAEGESRVVRGGSWLNDVNSCRVSYRGGNSPDYSNYYFGFRLARAVH